MSQQDQVLKLLREAGQKGVPNFVFFNNRILRASERVRELKSDGYHIETTRDKLPNGRSTNVFRYTLIEVKEKPKSRWGMPMFRRDVK